MISAKKLGLKFLSYTDSTTFALRIENVDITGFDGLKPEAFLHHLTHMKWQNQVKYCSGIVAFFHLPKFAIDIVM